MPECGLANQHFFCPVEKEVSKASLSESLNRKWNVNRDLSEILKTYFKKAGNNTSPILISIHNLTLLDLLRSYFEVFARLQLVSIKGRKGPYFSVTIKDERCTEIRIRQIVCPSLSHFGSHMK